jgi:transcriptional regulator CtsR
VPSQINYVLERRFTIDQGYLVESRRGGGGYIRIYRIEPEQVKPWQELIDNLGENKFEPARIRQLLKRLVEEKVVSRREASVLNAVIDDELYCSAGVSRAEAGKLQLNIFLSALREMLKTGY